MPPVEFEPTILAAKRPQTYSLGRVAIGSNLNNGSKLIETNFGIC